MKVHTKQVFTYLKPKGLKLGFLLKLGANLMKDGTERTVNGLLGEPLASWRNLGLKAIHGQTEGRPH